MMDTRANQGERRPAGCAEIIALILLLLWCLLPVAITVFDMAMGAAGVLFPGQSVAQAAAGYGLGNNYLTPIRFYRQAFRVLGIATLTFAVVFALLSWKRIFSRERVRTMPWFYALLLLLIWACVCAAMSDSLLRAFCGDFILYDGLFSYFVYAGVFICASMLRLESHRRLVLRVYAAMAVYLAAIMLMQEAGNAFLRACMPSKYAVIFNQFNHLGYVLCMGIVALAGLYLYDRRAGIALKAVYLAGFGMLTYALLLNDTFGSYLATVVALPVVYLFYGLSGRKFSLAALLPAALFILISAASYLGIGQSAATLSGNLNQLGTDINNIATGSEAAAQAGTSRFVRWMDTLKRIT